MSKSQVSRDPKMDIVRCFALLCVICVHFFKNTGFYEETVVGFGMLGLVIFRNFFMICVPLFILLSGYLLRNKTVTKQYYLRIIPILTVYVMASFACSLYTYIFDPENFSLTAEISRLFDYYATPYGWYIEMYIGLFLMIPFLNILYNQISTQKHKLLLIGSLFFITAGDTLMNDVFPLLPSYWEAMYPITFYFIGCYLSEYPLKVKWYVHILLIVVTFAVSGIVSCAYSFGSVFAYNRWQAYGSILTTLQAVLVFSFMSQWDCSKVGAKTGKLLSKVSSWCLGAYLVSWIFDSIFYKWLNTHQTDMLDKVKFFIPITIAVYVCSLLSSAMLNGIYNLTVGKIVQRFATSQKKVTS